MMSNENSLSITSVLNTLSQQQRQLAFQILKQYSQQGMSSILDQITYGDFQQIPVDIDTFLDDDQYLGKGLWQTDSITGKRRCTLWPYWRQTLKKVFPDNITTAYNTLILTGAIGIGKSMTAVLVMLYMLYRMLCLKDPYGYFGMQPIDKITFSMLNITLDAASGVAWDKAQQLIQSSPWFEQHGCLNASRTNPQWQPEKHIELIFGSSNRHIVGRALFFNMTDEVNFGIGNNVEKQKAKQKKMISQIDARMRSRFLRGKYLPTLNVIISSKDTQQAFLQSYINTKRQNESTTTLIIDQAQWIVDPRKGTPQDPGAFYVAVGNKFLAHQLLPSSADQALVDSYRQKGYTMVKVPPGYREVFEDNLQQALMDIVGLSTSSATKYISGVRLNQTKVETYRNPFNKDIITVGNSPDDKAQYKQFFDLAAVNPMDKSRPLFIHLDLSLTGDKSGIAGTWITGKRPTVDGQEASRELDYKLAFSVSIQAPKGFQVSFQKTRQFIRWLREQGFNVKGVSADTYNSANILQSLQADGFNTAVISVDRVDQASRINQPYFLLKTLIYQRHVQIYKKCDLLTDELISLQRKGDGHIDHTPDGAVNSKDQADAFCGSVYLASKFADQYSYDYGQHIEAALEANSQLTQANKRQAFIQQLQQDLLACWAEQDKAYSTAQTQQYRYYADISDGIIVL